MSKGPEVTIAWLEARGACESQIKLFRETFGESTRLTKKHAKYAPLFNMGWFILRALNKENTKKYYQVYIDYDKNIPRFRCMCNYDSPSEVKNECTAKAKKWSDTKAKAIYLAVYDLICEQGEVREEQKR